MFSFTPLCLFLCPLRIMRVSLFPLFFVPSSLFFPSTLEPELSGCSYHYTFHKPGFRTKSHYPKFSGVRQPSIPTASSINFPKLVLPSWKFQHHTVKHISLPNRFSFSTHANTSSDLQLCATSWATFTKDVITPPGNQSFVERFLTTGLPTRNVFVGKKWKVKRKMGRALNVRKSL